MEDNEPQIRLRQRKFKSRDEKQEWVETYFKKIQPYEEVSEEDSGSDGEWTKDLKKNVKKRKGAVDYVDKREQECARLIADVNSTTRKNKNTNVTKLKRAKSESETFSNNNLKLPHFPAIHSSNAKYRLHSVISQ